MKTRRWFNRLFNIYIRANHIDDQTLAPYRALVAELAEQFHTICERAAVDHTVRTDVPEEKMFRTTLHLMPAAVTRCAVGFVCSSEKDADALEELETLRNALFAQYAAGAETGDKRV